MRRRRKIFRGFTDKLYIANFVAVQFIVVAVILLTLFSGKLGITDMSALATLPACAYAELGAFSCLICWKNKCENMKKLGKTDDITFL